MNPTEQAAREYIRKRSRRPRLDTDPSGYYIPPVDDMCPLCQDARWVSSSGAHLKSIEHVAYKHHVSIPAVREMIREVERATDHGDIAYKCLRWNGKMLISPTYTTDDGSSTWLPRTVIVATCTNQDVQEHEPPNEQCSCGLWCYWDVGDAVAYCDYSCIVVQLRIGGKIIEGTEGARAQAATIIGLYGEYNGANIDLEAIATQYSVPLLSDDDINPIEILPADEEWEYGDM